MPEKKITKPEIISTIILICSFILNAFLGITNYKLQSSGDFYKKKLDSLEYLKGVIQNEKNKPQILYNTLFLRGTVLRELSKNEVPQQLKELIPKPEFYPTELLETINKKVEATNSQLRLKQMMGNFTTIANKGNLQIFNLKMHFKNSSSFYDLGSLDPGTCKLIATKYFQEQPFEEQQESKKFTKYSFSYRLGKDTINLSYDIDDKQIFWVPYSGDMKGIGKAIVDNENDVFLK